MLADLKEKDKELDMDFNEIESDEESEYEDIDLEGIYPRSIVLKTIGDWEEMLEPRSALVYYHNKNEEIFQKAFVIKADCIGSIKEDISNDKIMVTVTFFKKNV